MGVFLYVDLKRYGSSLIESDVVLQVREHITFSCFESTKLPTNFDSTYCYALGYGAGALLHSGETGLISSVGNLAAPVEECPVNGTTLTSLMDVERRHGKFKPVIKKAMVELQGAPFKKFASLRDEWALKNCYISPGPIQFVGPSSNATNHTLLLEHGAQV